MKYIKYLSFFFFIIIINSKVYSLESIVYLDINKILVNSIAGKNSSKLLELKFKKKSDEFNKVAKQLKEDETKIISQKNILSNEEYEKNIKSLRDRVKKYRLDRKKSFDEISNERASLSNKFIELLNPIITDYSVKNSISLVIQKKNIIVGKTELDITDKILLIVDTKITKINLDN